MPASIILRAARASDAALLSELALRSKAYWGYSPEFLDACRADLTVDPADCDGASVGVAERDGRVVGFWRLTPTGDPARGQLADFFVDPTAIGTGVGRLLLADAAAQSRGRGWHTLELDADPHAEAFYRRLGAVRIGSSASTAIEGRTLPRMSLRIPAEHQVVCGALVQDGRVLLGHRTATRRWFPDVWDLPGGHVDEGESELDALRRELREEVGVEVTGVDAEPVARLTGDRLQLSVWHVRDWAGRPANRCPDEHDELRWVAADELPGLRLAHARHLELLQGLLLSR